MYYAIENELLSAEINSMGAELHSLKSKKSGFEYLWQGNPDIWYGQSPVLFPIIGRLLDDKYRYEGREYTLQKHGFARKKEFTLVSCEGAKAVFSLKDSPETLEMYPFEFELRITFELDGGSLKVSHQVFNNSGKDMYFSLGAHPGFNCEIGDYLEFEENETLRTEKIDTDAYRIPETFPVLDNSKKIVITKDIFNDDALILPGVKSKKVTLKSDKHKRQVEFTLGSPTYLGIWAKPGAPYVCIEPWFGVNDNREKKDSISQKEGIVKLGAGDCFTQKWEAKPIDE